MHEPKGLGSDLRKDWPDNVLDDDRPAIVQLRPGTLLHDKVRDYLNERLERSERAMSQFYARWQANERRLQAYVNLPDYERLLKQTNATGAPPKVVNVTIPYSFAILSTQATYISNALGGRKPIFQIGSHKGETAENAQSMELVLQYQCDHMRFPRHLYQHITDGLSYGVGILRTAWKTEWKMRTLRHKQQPMTMMGAPLATNTLKVRQRMKVYEGNEAFSVDPFMFFPDPRFPMAEVNRRGEFVFWRSFEGKHTVKIAEAEGIFKWVDWISDGLPKSTQHYSDSARSLVAGGAANPGLFQTHESRGRDPIQLDQGTVNIIPAELGLGSSHTPEKWLFTIANKKTIIQAEPFDCDHDMHPVAVTEPLTTGYGFGHLGYLDYLAPMQDSMSWMLNAHIENIRAFLNNMLIVDPSMVEMQDLKRPGPGKLIRLKKSAYGQDVRQAVYQLQMYDVTRSHVNDMGIFMQLGERLSSVTDNLMGVQDKGGRKSATESRQSFEAGGARMGSLARFISSQSMIDTAEQMCLNTQQYLEDDFFLALIGQKGMEAPVHIIPDMLVGDFHFPIHDGTLPLDKVALLDVWKEIFLGVQGDPELRMSYSLPKIFEHIAELGGARNIDAFKVQVTPDAALAQGAAAGNVVPLSQAGGGGNQRTGLPQSPRDRAAGAI